MPRFADIAVLACLGACAGGPPAGPAPASRISVDWAFGGRARVAHGDSAMVVSEHPVASEIGRDILRRGGNAVDAAVAVGFALAVVHPEAGNIGGGGYMLIRTRMGDLRALDYRETAPARATRDMYLDSLGRPTDRSLTGHLAAGVPGSVAGLAEAHRTLGRLPFRDLVDPAIRLARDGFVLDEYRTRSIEAASRRLALFSASRASFLPGGRPPVAGSRLLQPDLARTLEAVRNRGRDGFYRGAVADLLVAEEDTRSFRCRRRRRAV
jgi:gamma-glutamyltranspeptidase/glutathione hydrolase